MEEAQSDAPSQPVTKGKRRRDLVGKTGDSHARKRQVARNNRKALDELKISYEDHGSVLLMRFRNKPPVEFYPETGQWHDHHGKLYTGGAKSFLLWYSRLGMAQSEKRKPLSQAAMRVAALLAKKEAE